MHIDLVKVWIIPNSTVCISLLEQILKESKSFDELLLFTMFALLTRTLFPLVVPLTAEFQGLRFFLICSQLESPHSMRTFFQKVKRFVRNNFKKIIRHPNPIGKIARNQPFLLLKKFLLFFNIFYLAPKYDSQLLIFMIRFLFEFVKIA